MSTEKKQRKALDAVGPLLGPDVKPRAYVAARANARMSPAVTYAIVGLLILLVVVAVATQRIIIPGVLVFAFFISAIKPLRGIAVTDTGVVVVSTSAVTAKPKSVLGELPHAVLLPPHIHWARDTVVQVPLGPDVVRLKGADYERLKAALPAASLAAAGLAPAGPDTSHGYDAPPSAGTTPGWYPMNGDEYRQGYWSGSAWTAVKDWNGSDWVDVESSRH